MRWEKATWAIVKRTHKSLVHSWFCIWWPSAAVSVCDRHWSLKFPSSYNLFLLVTLRLQNARWICVHLVLLVASIDVWKMMRTYCRNNIVYRHSALTSLGEVHELNPVSRKHSFWTFLCNLQLEDFNYGWADAERIESFPASRFN